MKIFGILPLIWACASKEILYVVDDTDTEDTEVEDTDNISILEEVGSEGGTVEAIGGTGTVTLEIPAGALVVEVEIGIEEIAFEELYLSTTLEGLIDVAGGAYVFTPHGTTFTEPVAITLPQTGIADTILRLDDEYDMTWEMAPNASFTANQASFQTSTFSVYLPISVCKTYCDNVEQLCSALPHETCLDTCQIYNISNPPSTCTTEVADNFVCLTDARLAVTDFDCITGAPVPTTCEEEQADALDCATGVCSDLSGSWYVRIAENEETWTTNDLSGDPITLVVEGEGALVAFADLPQGMRAVFPETDYSSVYKVEFETSDVYGIPLQEDVGPYPNVFLSEDSQGELQVALVTDSLVTTTPSQSCTPSDQSIEFSLDLGNAIVREFSFERDLDIRDGDGDGIGLIAGDCDDSDGNIYPGANEILDDGIDQDCNGTVTNIDPSITSSHGVNTYNDSVLICSAIGDNIRDQTLNYNYSWLINGGSYSGSVQNLADIVVSPGAIVECAVTVSDINGGIVSSSTTATLDNRLPSVDSVSIFPNTGVLSDSELVCLAAVSDPDGESLSASYEWFVSGTLIGANATIQLDNSLVSPNDSVECVATVTDGLGASDSDSSAVTIDNRAPSVDSVSISPNIGVLNDSELICLAAVSDPDGESVSASYEWFVSGALIGANATIQLDNSLVSPNDSVECVATVTDGLGASASDSSVVTIENQAPSVDSVSVSPNIGVLNDSGLTCFAVVSDPDGESLSASYEWYVFGVKIGANATIQLSNSLVSPNDDVECVATVIDGFGASASDKSTVTIDNRAPSDPTLLITWTGTEVHPTDLDDLTCLASGSIDLDGQVVTYSYSWTSDSGNTVSGATLSSSETLTSDLWTCTGTASDGGLSAQTSETVEIIIVNSWDNCPTGQSLNDAWLNILGEEVDDFAGMSVSSAGDVDGDGLDDILIGAHGNGAGGIDAGKVYLILGSSLSTFNGDLSSADYNFIGAQGDQAGFSVSSAGDVDGDGLDDILIGAQSAFVGGSQKGRIYLILGSSLGSTPNLDPPLADYIFNGEASGDQAGHVVSSAGDVNGDGHDDILIGAPGNDTLNSDGGKTYLILGGVTLPQPSPNGPISFNLSNADYSFVGENSSDHSGYSVSSAGDVDADGHDDILIGAYGHDNNGSEAGKTYLILGSNLNSYNPTRNLSSAEYAFTGENAQDQSGRSVSSAGDVDGDGFDDILIGASRNNEAGIKAGKSYLILGSGLQLLNHPITQNVGMADYFFTGESGSDQSGRSVASAGDVDGDGLDDILIGSPRREVSGGAETGKSYLILGSSLSNFDGSLSSADYSFTGDASNDWAGGSVSSAGDVDGDGFDDILIGASRNNEGASDAGKVALFKACD